MNKTIEVLERERERVVLKNKKTNNKSRDSTLDLTWMEYG